VSQKCQKYSIFLSTRGFFKAQNAPKPVYGRTPPRTPAVSSFVPRPITARFTPFHPTWLWWLRDALAVLQPFHCSLMPTLVSVCYAANKLWQQYRYCDKKSTVLSTVPTQGASRGGSECSSRISGAYFYIVLLSNYGSILRSFRDMTTRRTTDRRRQSTCVWPLVSNNSDVDLSRNFK